MPDGVPTPKLDGVPLPEGVQMPPGLFLLHEDRPHQNGADEGLAPGSGNAEWGEGSLALVESTDLARGPWEHGVMHGGSVCGLLGWAVERELRRGLEGAAGESVITFERFLCTRLTVEILSGVPVGRLTVGTRVIKSGRRTATVDASFWRTDDLGRKVLARASSQWLTKSSDDQGRTQSAPQLPPSQLPPPRPAERSDPTAKADIDYPRPGFNVDGVELRNVEGSTEEAGPGRSWIRLGQPLFAGQETTPFSHIAALSDMAAAIGWDYTHAGGSYINTDVTLQLLRMPLADWVFMDSSTISVGNGIACGWSTISDEAGRLGWVMQSKVEAPFELHSAVSSTNKG